jgi:hypothetical protein
MHVTSKVSFSFSFTFFFLLEYPSFHDGFRGLVGSQTTAIVTTCRTVSRTLSVSSCSGWPLMVQCCTRQTFPENGPVALSCNSSPNLIPSSMPHLTMYSRRGGRRWKLMVSSAAGGEVSLPHCCRGESAEWFQLFLALIEVRHVVFGIIFVLRSTRFLSVPEV